MNYGIRTACGILAVVVATFLTIAMLLRFERPPIETVQTGYRGTGMQELYNPRLLAEAYAANVIPASLPPLPATGAPAGTVYKNVKVLGGLSVGQFTRLMASITTWVAPTQGCAYCHDTKNMASDALYTKVVARRMIQMVQHINGDWKDHVAATGVTCYTCHRGMPVPAHIWFNDPGPHHAGGFAEASTGKNIASGTTGDTSLPYDPFTPFLEKSVDIRVQATQALPGTDPYTIKDTDWTYALMMNISQSLGVNCTYCHMTRSFGDWSQSTPKRVTAWYGIRMVRNLNNDYLDPLHGVFPAIRLGVEGDSPKVNCATCHQGVNKPLFGVSMLKGFPELASTTATAMPAPAPAAPAATPAPAAPAQ
jgi:photosynthetic reaction center cytochrome c subunit